MDLQYFLDFFFYFSCPLGIELFFIGGKLAEQSQKLSSVYTFLVRYILEYFHGELVVSRLAKLHVQLNRFAAATMKRIALTSSSSVSFLSFANPEKGDPNSGMFILL